MLKSMMIFAFTLGIHVAPVARAMPHDEGDIAPQELAKGVINCIYGNRGGYCEIIGPSVSYTVDLSSRNPVSWFFEGRELPTEKQSDVDIVMPVFEATALTHFQNCDAVVSRQGEALQIRIFIRGCVHERAIYEPLLNTTD